MTKSRSEEEAAAELRNIEQEADLLHFRVRGYSPWRVLRFPVGVALQNLPFQPSGLPKKALLRACLRSLYDLIRLPRGRRYVVKSFASAMRSKSVQGYEDQYFEALLQEVPGGLRLYSLNAVGYEARIPAWQGPQADVTAILVIGALLARLFPVRDDGRVFERIAAAVASRLPAAFFPEQRIRRMFSSFWWQSKLYGWLLRYVGVQSVLVADTGERALLKGAREAHCRFVELQHGIFSPHHPDALPGCASLDPDDPGLLLPDVIATYGSFWANAHDQTLLGQAGRVHPVGASFMERLRSRTKAAFDERPPRLLVTTQGLAREEMIALLLEFLNACPIPLVLNIKLHPAYDVNSDDYRAAFDSDPRVNIIPGNADPDTYRLLAESDLHLSISSACHYDAIGLQVPTVVLALPNHELVLDLVRSGEALLVRSGVELAAVVKSKAWIPVSATVAAKYYRSGFVGNLSAWMVVA